MVLALPLAVSVLGAIAAQAGDGVDATLPAISRDVVEICPDLLVGHANTDHPCATQMHTLIFQREQVVLDVVDFQSHVPGVERLPI